VVGTATPSPAAVRFGYATYALTTDPTLSDLRVLATSHVGAQHAWLAWPWGGTRRVRSGKDSADLELLDYMKGPKLWPALTAWASHQGTELLPKRSPAFRGTGPR